MRIHNTHLALLFCMLLFLITGTLKVYASNLPISREIVVRTDQNFHSEDDVKVFVDSLAENDINTIYVNFKNDDDREFSSGAVYYPSEFAPAVEGYNEKDLLKAVIDNAHAKNIRVFAWVPQFHDKILAEQRSDLRMQTVRNGKSVVYINARNEFFVNPLHPDVQNYELNILREIATNYNVDGIVLDWLRFDNYAMDLSEYTRELYKKEKGYDPATINFKKNNHRRKVWNEWRERKLADYVVKVAQTIKEVRPGMQIGAFVLPPEFVECGQNISFFKESLDFILPMAYYEDWGKEPEWVWENVLADTSRKVPRQQIIPTLGMDWREDVYAQLFKHMRRDYTQIHRVSLFLYGKWTDAHLARVAHIVDLW